MDKIAGGTVDVLRFPADGPSRAPGDKSAYGGIIC